MRRFPATRLVASILVWSLAACASAPYLDVQDAVRIREIAVELEPATTAATLDDVATGKLSGALEGAGRTTTRGLAYCPPDGMGVGMICAAILLPFTLIGGAIQGAVNSTAAATVTAQIKAFNTRLEHLDLAPMLRERMIEESRRHGAADLFSLEPASADTPVLKIAQQGFLLDGEEADQQTFRVYPIIIASLTLAGETRPRVSRTYAGHWEPVAFVDHRLEANPRKLEDWVAMSDAEFGGEMSKIVGDYAAAITTDLLQPWTATLIVATPTSRPHNGWWYKPVEAQSQPDLVWRADELAEAWAPIVYDIRIIETDPELWQYIYQIPRHTLSRQFGEMPSLYERSGITGTHHRVDTFLEPCKTYLWAVRARGPDRATGWQFLTRNNSRVTTFRTACGKPEPTSARIAK